jgi:hypothetical protein
MRMTRTTKAVQLAIMAGAAGAVALAQQQIQIQPTLVAEPTFKFVSGNLIGGSVVKGAPYSAEAVTDTTQTLADGNRIVQHSTATEYRDSEGRERREQVLANLGGFSAQSNPVQTIFISDPVAGVNYSLNSSDRSAMKLPVPTLPPPPPGGGFAPDVLYRQVTINGVSVSGPASGPGPMIAATVSSVAGPVTATAGPGSNAIFVRRGMVSTAGATFDQALPAPNVEQLGSKSIAGVSATGTRTTITIPAGQIGNDQPIVITDERWYSPELQVTVQSTHSDPRVGATTYALQNVSRAEPSPTLFQVPADYAVTDAPEPFTKRVMPLP